MIGQGMALDPGKYFIIVPNLFGNGLSSSPSNTSPPYDRARFPGITYYDNIMCQHRLVIEHFGVERIARRPLAGWRSYQPPFQASSEHNAALTPSRNT